MEAQRVYATCPYHTRLGLKLDPFKASNGDFSAAAGPMSVISDCRNTAFYTYNPVYQTSLTKLGALATLGQMPT